MDEMLTTEFRAVGCCNADPKDTSWNPSACIDRRLVAKRSDVNGLWAVRAQEKISRAGEILKMDEHPFNWMAVSKDLWGGWKDYTMSLEEAQAILDDFTRKHKTGAHHRI